jgi:hypothetical protein
MCKGEIQLYMFMFYVSFIYGVIVYDYVKIIYKFEVVLIIHYVLCFHVFSSFLCMQLKGWRQQMKHLQCYMNVMNLCH